MLPVAQVSSNPLSKKPTIIRLMTDPKVSDHSRPSEESVPIDIPPNPSLATSDRPQKGDRSGLGVATGATTADASGYQKQYQTYQGKAEMEVEVSADDSDDSGDDHLDGRQRQGKDQLKMESSGVNNATGLFGVGMNNSAIGKKRSKDSESAAQTSSTTKKKKKKSSRRGKTSEAPPFASGSHGNMAPLSPSSPSGSTVLQSSTSPRSNPRSPSLGPAANPRPALSENSPLIAADPSSVPSSHAEQHLFPGPCAGTSSVSKSSGGTTPSNLRDKFPFRLYDMIDYCNSHFREICCWTEKGDGFVVADPVRIAQTIIPLYFSHSNYTSFIRQLNNYGFSKRSEATIPHAAVMDKNPTALLGPGSPVVGTSSRAGSISSSNAIVAPDGSSSPIDGDGRPSVAALRGGARPSPPNLTEDENTEVGSEDILTENSEKEAGSLAFKLLGDAAASLESGTVGAPSTTAAGLAAAARVAAEEKYEVFHHKDHLFRRGRRDLLGSIGRLPTERRNISTAAAVAAVGTIDRFEERMMERIEDRIERLEDNMSTFKTVLVKRLDRLEQLMSQLLEREAGCTVNSPMLASVNGKGLSELNRTQPSMKEKNRGKKCSSMTDEEPGAPTSQQALNLPVASCSERERSKRVAAPELQDRETSNPGWVDANTTSTKSGAANGAIQSAYDKILQELTQASGGIATTSPSDAASIATAILARRHQAEAQSALRAALEGRVIQSQQDRIGAQALTLPLLNYSPLDSVSLAANHLQPTSIASLTAAASIGVSSPAADAASVLIAAASKQQEQGKKAGGGGPQSGNTARSPTAEETPSCSDVSHSCSTEKNEGNTSTTGKAPAPGRSAATMAAIMHDTNATSWDRFLATSFLAPVPTLFGASAGKPGGGVPSENALLLAAQHRQALLFQRQQQLQQQAQNSSGGVKRERSNESTS